MRGARGATVQRSGRARPARPMDWEGFTGAATVAAAAKSAFYALLPSTSRTYYTDPTLMGGRIHVASVLSTTAGLGNIGFGLIRWTDANDTVPADLPDPIVDSDLDWIWTYYVPVVPSGAASFDNNANAESTLRFKSKRRLGSDAGLLFVCSNDGGASVSFSAIGRLLIKE